ncbi:TetR/AcrR family transcriptional regulator [Kitasatospora sp. NPDC059722]|uniref:TetR/AcrR family transcriptional regulator n=1 Tax=Kitasatospora sp. NPDC059722 TaxID=3346925 RepID=UPI0036CCF137
MPTPRPTPTTPPPLLRKDAARNWEQIVAVARGLVDRGEPLHLNDIARRAGLGVGTVYRHFATPEALLETVAAPCLEGLVAHGEQALAAADTDADAWSALEGFLYRTVEAQVTDASLTPVTAAATDALPRTTELKAALFAAGTALLHRAHEAGVVRRDVTAADLVPLMCGVAHAVDVHHTTAPASARSNRLGTAHRYLAALLGGLHA